MPQLKILFRRLGRDRLMTLFTVCGLVAGISAFLLLFIHVMNERQFDRHIREYENIYRVLSTPAGIDQAPWARSLGLVHSAAANIPGIELATQFTHCDGGRIRMGERSMVQDNIMSVDEAFIQMFGVESRLGNLRDLEKPNTVFISEDFAKKYFGDQDPVGQLIHIEALQYVRDLGAYEIRGIVRNTDSRTHFRYALLISQKGGLQERFEQLANRKVPLSGSAKYYLGFGRITHFWLSRHSISAISRISFNTFSSTTSTDTSRTIRIKRVIKI